MVGEVKEHVSFTIDAMALEFLDETHKELGFRSKSEFIENAIYFCYYNKTIFKERFEAYKRWWKEYLEAVRRRNGDRIIELLEHEPWKIPGK